MCSSGGQWMAALGGDAEAGSEQVLSEGKFGKNFICPAERRENEQGRVWKIDEDLWKHDDFFPVFQEGQSSTQFKPVLSGLCC